MLMFYRDVENRLFQYLQEKVAKIAMDIYAMESMGYLVAGTIDTHIEHDTALESAIIKVHFR